MATTMTRWDPIQHIAHIQHELDRAFGGLLPDGEQARLAWMPAVDVEQTDDEIILRFDLPGMNRDDVSIDVRDRTLVVSGEPRKRRRRTTRGSSLASASPASSPAVSCCPRAWIREPEKHSSRTALRRAHVVDDVDAPELPQAPSSTASGSAAAMRRRCVNMSKMVQPGA
jgi:hypothetical protein